MSCKCFCNKCGDEVGKKYFDGLLYQHTKGMKPPDGAFVFHLCNTCMKGYIKSGCLDGLWGKY